MAWTYINHLTSTLKQVRSIRARKISFYCLKRGNLVVLTALFSFHPRLRFFTEHSRVETGESLALCGDFFHAGSSMRGSELVSSVTSGSDFITFLQETNPNLVFFSNGSVLYTGGAWSAIRRFLSLAFCTRRLQYLYFTLYNIKRKRRYFGAVAQLVSLNTLRTESSSQLLIAACCALKQIIVLGYQAFFVFLVLVISFNLTRV